MNRLTKECFLNNSGFAFEDLIHEILKEEYGDIFQHTHYTNDGGKDFESNNTQIFSAEKIWAECKKYTKPLSYDDISKTLLMAYVKEINKLLIFSFSPVNHRFYKHLAEYKYRTGIEVEVYDDINLENLLLKYKNKAWFSNYIDITYANTNKLANSLNPTSELKYIYKLSTHQNYQKHFQNVNVFMFEVISFDLLIINPTMKDQILNVDYSEFSQHSEFELLNQKELNNKKELIIPKGSALLNKLYVRIVKFQSSYQIPAINISGKRCRPKCNLQTTWLAATGLIGKDYQDYEREIINRSTYVKKLSFAVIKGATGTGKSKFLKDLNQKMYGENFKCYYCDIDTRKVTVQLLCRELFSLFTNLPYFKISKKKITNILSNTTNNEKIELAYEILYNNNYNYGKNIDKIIRCIFDCMQKKPYFIILDNIQKFDSLSLKLIEKLIEISSNAMCPSIITLSFNTDYIHMGTSAYELLHQLENLSAKKPDRFFIATLKGFGEEDARKYIQYCLQITHSSQHIYRRTISTIINRIGVNPLVLQSYLIYMYRSHIVDAHNQHFTILNLEMFLDSSDSTEENFDHLMDELEYRILQNEQMSNNDKSIYLNIVNCLSLFKQLPFKVIDILDKEKKVIPILKNYGIIQLDYDTKQYFRFRHIEYVRYYLKKYDFECIPYRLILDYFKTSIHRDQYIECIFLLEYRNEEINKDTVFKIENAILHNAISYEYLKKIYLCIIQLYCINFEPPSKRKLHVMNCICETSLHILGTVEAIDIQQKVLDVFIYNPAYLSLEPEIVIGIFKTLLHNLMNEGRLFDANTYHDKICKLVIEQKKGIYKKYIKEMSKEQILLLYKQGNTKKAIISAESLLSQLNINTLEYAECLMYLGNVYYRSENFLNEKKNISKYWRKAYVCIRSLLSTYDSIEDYNTRSILLNIVIKNCLVDIYENGKINSFDYEFVKQVIDHTNMIYFEVKMRQLLSLGYLMQSNYKDKIQVVIHLLGETLDMLATDYGNKALYADSLFFLAEVYKMKNDYDSMYDYYLSFYGLFLQLYLSNNQQSNNYYLLFEMCNSLKKYKNLYSKTFDENILNALSDTSLYNRLINILHMPEEKFFMYYANNCKTSIFFRCDQGANLPMI